MHFEFFSIFIVYCACVCIQIYLCVGTCVSVYVGVSSCRTIACCRQSSTLLSEAGYQSKLITDVAWVPTQLVLGLRVGHHAHLAFMWVLGIQA